MGRWVGVRHWGVRRGGLAVFDAVWWSFVARGDKYLGFEEGNGR